MKGDKKFFNTKDFQPYGEKPLWQRAIDGEFDYTADSKYFKAKQMMNSLRPPIYPKGRPIDFKRPL